MDTFRLVCSIISFVSNISLVLLIINIRLTYFASFKWYILLLPVNNILYTFILHFMDIHHGTYGNAVFTASFGIIPGLKGVGIYLACISNYFSTFFLLFLFRFSLIYKGEYASSSLHGFLSSSSSIFPVATFIVMIDSFYFSLPIFFYRPDYTAVDYIAPAMKSFFDKGRDYGYVMQIIWIHGTNEFRIRNCLGAVGTITIIISSIISFAYFSNFIRRFSRNSFKTKSRTRRIREGTLYRTLLSQVGIFYVCIVSAQLILTIVPFFPFIITTMPYFSFFFKITVVVASSISPILLFIQFRDLRVVVYNWLMRSLDMDKRTVRIDKTTTRSPDDDTKFGISFILCLKVEMKMAGASFAFLRVIVLVFSIFILLVVAVAVYRPLPAEITSSIRDRVTMHILEPVTRIGYYYPSRLCPSAECMLHWSRRSLSAMTAMTGPLFERESNMLMETTYWNGVKVRVYHPRNRSTADSDGVIIFMHGGGFGLGDTVTYEPLTRPMAEELNVRLFVSIDYRLTPGTIFPGQIEDCERVIECVIAKGPSEYGIDTRKIVVMGDSAGGNLVASITQRRRARGAEPKFLGQVLLYPLLQLSDLQTYSYRYSTREMNGLAFIDPYAVAFFYLLYAGVDVNARPEFIDAALGNGHVSLEVRKQREQYMNYSLLPDAFRYNGTEALKEIESIEELANFLTPFLTNPDFAPLMQSDLSGLPSAIVVTNEFDVLRDEGTMYARRLEAAGVNVQWNHYKHGFHGMLNLHNHLEIGRQALSDVEEWTMKLLREKK